MLVRYKVANFKSINNLQEFTMVAGSTRGNPSHMIDCSGVTVLKNSVIYGANAGGKTNLIKSIETSKMIIQYGATYPSYFCEYYCRANEENHDKETYFEYLLESNNKLYYYGFEIILSKRMITREWLYKYDPKMSKSTMVFEKEADDKGTYKFGDLFTNEEKSRLLIYADDMSEKKEMLFIKEVSEKKTENDSSLRIFKEVMNWFVNKLYVNSIPVPKKESYIKSAELLKSLDAGISEFKFIDVNGPDDPRFAKSYKEVEKLFSTNAKLTEFIIPGALFTRDGENIFTQEICTLHDYAHGLFHLNEESSGVVQALHYLPALLTEYDGYTFIFDEYGSNMHPILSYKFIEKFQDHNIKSNNQLIIATHHTSLMSLDLFRRDEIWFAEKNNGTTDVYSLEEFEVRSDKRIDKAYLEGRFGALPVFKDVDENENLS